MDLNIHQNTKKYKIWLCFHWILTKSLIFVGFLWDTRKIHKENASKILSLC